MKDKTGRPRAQSVGEGNFQDLEKRSMYIPAGTIKAVHITDDAVTLDKVADDVIAEMIKYAIVLGG